MNKKNDKNYKKKGNPDKKNNKRDKNIFLITYDKNYYKEIELNDIKKCKQYLDKDKKIWINLIGVKQNDTIRDLKKLFNIHPVVIEDIFNKNQRAKFEDFQDYIYLVIKIFGFDKSRLDANTKNIFKKEYKSKTGNNLSNDKKKKNKNLSKSNKLNINYINYNKIIEEQISIILGKNFIITILQNETDIFDKIVGKLKTKESKINYEGSDYLLYTIIDTVINNYFISLEIIGDEIEKLENKIISKPDSKVVKTIHRLKRLLIVNRKSVWPLREILNFLGKGESSLISKSVIVYFRNLYEHIVQLIDTIETYREMITDLFDIYLSSVSNKTNEIMKVLTVISTIFIPLTFITGIYGMNFIFMPELKWRYGYIYVLGLMLVIGIVMIIYFKKKKWF